MSRFGAYQPVIHPATTPGLGHVALCVGIDNYPHPSDRLGGCVNDARDWSDWFRSQGFQTSTLLDSEATGSGIKDAIWRLISSSRAGQVIALHYSGHGTQLPDSSRDEQEGMDEAIVPFDHRQNGYLVDDDMAELCNAIPHGVNVTFFMDCCHSGTITRMFTGAADAPGQDAKVRFLPPDEKMIATHRRTRRQGGRRGFRSAYTDHREILMAACLPHQTAKERAGGGDFTRYALGVLQQGRKMTNAEFINQVLANGTFDNQQPTLYADERMFGEILLGRRVGTAAAFVQPASTALPRSTELTVDPRELTPGEQIVILKGGIFNSDVEATFLGVSDDSFKASFVSGRLTLDLAFSYRVRRVAAPAPSTPGGLLRAAESTVDPHELTPGAHILILEGGLFNRDTDATFIGVSNDYFTVKPENWCQHLNLPFSERVQPAPGPAPCPV